MACTPCKTLGPSLSGLLRGGACDGNPRATRDGPIRRANRTSRSRSCDTPVMGERAFPVDVDVSGFTLRRSSRAAGLWGVYGRTRCNDRRRRRNWDWPLGRNLRSAFCWGNLVRNLVRRFSKLVRETFQRRDTAISAERRRTCQATLWNLSYGVRTATWFAREFSTSCFPGDNGFICGVGCTAQTARGDSSNVCHGALKRRAIASSMDLGRFLARHPSGLARVEVKRSLFRSLARDRKYNPGVEICIQGANRCCLPESMCDKDDIIEGNIRSVKLSSPDVSPAIQFCQTTLISRAHRSTSNGTRKRPSRITGNGSSSRKRSTRK